jgi:DNA-binding GntR family transcriptional regulator
MAEHGLIDVTNINEKIYDLIKKRITRYEYPPGHQISIRKLQEELGVSNSPIKDSLFRLAGEGLVEITSRKGTFVKHISKKELHEIEEVRKMIEIGAVEIVAPTVTDDQIRRLEECYQATLIPDDRFDYGDFMEKDSRFHQALIQLTGNERLIGIYQQLNAHVHIVRFQLARNRKKALPWTHSDHQAILDALRARDAEGAKAAVREHRDRAREAFLEDSADDIP